MSDKKRVDEKISFRVSKILLDFVDENVASRRFENRSTFFRQAIDYYTRYLRIICIGANRAKFILSEENKASEGLLHCKLKDFAFSLLEGIGCYSIDLEKTIIVEGKRIKVDLVGELKNGKNIAIECWVSSTGDTKRLDAIAQHFDEVYILTPIELVKWYESVLNSYKEALDALSQVMPTMVFNYRPDKIEDINDSEKVGRQLIPYNAIKEELKRDHVTILEEVSENTMRKLQEKLQHELGVPISYEKIIDASRRRYGWIIKATIIEGKNQPKALLPLRLNKRRLKRSTTKDGCL